MPARRYGSNKVVKFLLGPMGPNPDVGIGIFGDYEDFTTIIDDYRSFATQIFFPTRSQL